MASEKAGICVSNQFRGRRKSSRPTYKINCVYQSSFLKQLRISYPLPQPLGPRNIQLAENFLPLCSKSQQFLESYLWMFYFKSVPRSSKFLIFIATGKDNFTVKHVLDMPARYHKPCIKHSIPRFTK